MLTKLNNLYNQIKEEVSTFLEKENKLQKQDSSEASSNSDTTDTSNTPVENECCEVAAGMDVGSVMRSRNSTNIFS